MDKQHAERLQEVIYEIMEENAEETSERFATWFSCTLAAKVAITRYQRVLGFTPQTMAHVKQLCKWAWYAREHECAVKDLKIRVLDERIAGLETENKKLRWTIENVLGAETTAPAAKSVHECIHGLAETVNTICRDGNSPKS